MPKALRIHRPPTAMAKAVRAAVAGGVDAAVAAGLSRARAPSNSPPSPGLAMRSPTKTTIRVHRKRMASLSRRAPRARRKRATAAIRPKAAAGGGAAVADAAIGIALVMAKRRFNQAMADPSPTYRALSPISTARPRPMTVGLAMRRPPMNGQQWNARSLSGPTASALLRRPSRARWPPKPIPRAAHRKSRRAGVRPFANRRR